MTSFQKTWAQREVKSMTEKIRDTVKPQGALKPRIQTAVNKLQVQTSKMDVMLTKLHQRDQQLFDRIVTATQSHDTPTSRVLSSELAEVRKVSRVLGNARNSLEQVQLRLTTIHDLGDAMIAIGPAMSTMKELKPTMSKFMPEADSELNTMTETLNGLMVDSLSGDSFEMQDSTMTEETNSILQEAEAVASQQTDEKFPSIPTMAPTGLPSQTQSNTQSNPMDFLE
ncbi:MAG: Cell division protein B2 [Thaumarchaeota archaeon]|jgi:division protein CdvB (Snf7/Vps24/ESCRT-III family)|nr:Cell division protein B2 [Nitrososphaerota archaeon]